jgi:hypothetical protein
MAASYMRMFCRTECVGSSVWVCRDSPKNIAIWRMSLELASAILANTEMAFMSGCVSAKPPQSLW